MPAASPGQHNQDLVDGYLAQAVPDKGIFMLYPDGFKFTQVGKGAKSHRYQPGFHIVDNGMVVFQLYQQRMVVPRDNPHYFGQYSSLL